MESVDLGHLLDSRLEAAIEELREKSETEIAQYKLEVEAAYKDKVHTLGGEREGGRTGREGVKGCVCVI